MAIPFINLCSECFFTCMMVTCKNYLPDLASTITEVVNFANHFTNAAMKLVSGLTLKSPRMTTWCE